MLQNLKPGLPARLKISNPHNYFERKEARKIDRFTQFALIASDEAVKDANISKDNVNTDG